TPTGTALVSAACETCHLPPAHAGDTGARNLDGGTPAAYHASLGAQPSSCVDCHANTRPKAVLSLTSADDPAIPSGVAVHFDHNVPAASGDCVACHASHTDTWA